MLEFVHANLINSGTLLLIMEKKTFLWKEKVRIYDTDAQGVVHYAGYYRFFTDAFEQFSRSVLDSSFPILDGRTWFVVAESNAKYHRPSRLGDELHVHVSAEMPGPKAIKFIFRILVNEILVCEGYIVQVAIDSKKWKAIRVPPHISRKIKKLGKKS